MGGNLKLAKYSVRGLALINRVANMREALKKAQADDDILWTGKENEIGLSVNVPVRIIGSNSAKMKVPEHSVGIQYKGSGSASIENVKFYCKQICNAIYIDNWNGNLLLKDIVTVYNSHKLDKVYETITGINLRNTNISIIHCQISKLGLSKAKFTNLKSSVISNGSQISSDDLKIKDTQFVGNTFIVSKKCSVDSSSFQQTQLTGEGTLSNISVNNELTLSGNLTINHLVPNDPENIPTLILKDGTFVFLNTDLTKFKVIANNSDLVIKENSKINNEISGSNNKISNQTLNTLESEAQKELNGLIGLAPVKSEIKGYVNAARIAAAREKAGLQQMDMSLHMAFLGSPGTGKTTVAEILGRLLFEQGILKTSNFIHVGRKDLIGTVVGESEKNLAEALEAAMGGILFIDEAYSLLSNDSSQDNDYGVKVVDELTDEVEKKHQDLIVILAGYNDSMTNFFNVANPGLKSRVTNWIDFPDYSLNELYEIAILKLSKQYILDDEVKKYVFTGLKQFYEAKVVNGNGRFVRNFVQNISIANSNRLTSQNTLDKKSLQTLVAKDVIEGYNIQVRTIKKQNESY